MKNSFRHMQINDLEQAWTLLEEAMKESKAEYVETMKNEKANGVSNGNSNGTSNGKRKLLDESLDEEVENNESTEPTKKKKKSEEGSEDVTAAETEESSEKFSWGETIRNILLAKNNELNLKKLKKKVIRKYQTLTGSEWSEKVENKFNKKINKLKGVVIDNEKIRLIE